MAAGQQKKRLISSSLPECYKEKKKKRLKSSDYMLDVRSQVYLEDKNQEIASAHRKQVGITWKDMGPYIDSTSKHGSGVADVVCVPKEIYDLDNLEDVLSHEVWSTCLSESERKFLVQFLPNGMDMEQVVRPLLSGENHHFGNPSFLWSSLLCSGNLHPDAVLQKERQIKSNKKQYYPELRKYHTNMIERLKILKAQWKNSKESETSKESIKPKVRSLPASSAKVKEPPQKVQIRAVDTSKYMSYIKITKKQHEAIKSNLRSSGDAIQSKSISRVLGDIKNFPVHPFEELEKEDKLKLQERWLQVVKKDLPVAFEEYKTKILKREELMKRLEQELSEKQTLIADKVDACMMEISPQENMKEEEVYDQNPGDVLIPNTAISASFNSDMGLISLDKEPAIQDVFSPEENCPLVSQLNVKENLLDYPVEPNTLSSPPKRMWQAVDNPFVPSSSFSLGAAKLEQTEEHQVNIFNMENNVAPSNNAAVFTSYSSQRVSSHLPAFPKAPEMLLSYPQDNNINPHIRQPKMQFMPGNANMQETAQLPLFQEQQQNINKRLLVNRSIAGTTQFPNQFHQQQNLKNTIFSNRSYQNEELHPSTSSKLMNQNWYPNNQCVNNSNNTYWSGVGTSNVNPDGSLLSVLSSCGNLPNLPSQLQNNNLISSEPLNYVPNENYSYVPQFNSLSSHEAVANSVTAALPNPWINFQTQQNSNLQDSTGKPFVRPWNQ